MKVATVVGTRPEIIRLSRVMVALDRYLDHVLIHTGQNYDYELNQIFFDDLELRPPDVYLDAAADTAAETIGRVIALSDAAFRKTRPDAVLILGDTNSSLAAYAAKRLRIPIFHMEAGNRCFDERVPEEVNRRIVDHIADVNMPYSSIAREYLLAEGLPADRIVKTGSPMYEVLHHYLPKIESSDSLTRLALEPQKFFLVSCHREENVDSPELLRQFVRVMRNLATEFGLPVVVSTHPRTRKRLEAEAVEFGPEVRLLKPLAFTDYVKLEMSARATLSDSGTIAEEASILNFPALNLRQTHERPEGMEETAVVMVGFAWERVRETLEVLEKQPRGAERLFRTVGDYQAPAVSEKVVRIILSYTDYVMRMVWKEGV